MSLLSRINHAVGVKYRKKLNGDGKHRSTVNCLTRGWKVGTFRGEWRWALVNVSPSIQKKWGKHLPGFWGYWRYLRSAGSWCMWFFGDGVSLFRSVLSRDCLQHPNSWSYISVLLVGWRYTAINAARAVTEETGNTGQCYISYCSMIALDKLWIFFYIFVRKLQTYSTRNKARGVPGCAVVALKNSPYSTIHQLVAHLPRW